ncbi:MAG: lysozyme [Roseibium sp.]
MRTSLDGCLSIIAFEGIVLETYSDSVGVLTIGVGHTRFAGDPAPTPGMKLSIEEAVRVFQQDLQKYEREVKAEIDVPLSQSEFDALVSWHFNTGRVSNSTLGDKLNDNDKAGAALEFPRWNKAKGKVLEGLVRRRVREKAIFESGDYGDDRVAVKNRGSSPAKSMTRLELSNLLSGFEAPDPTTNVSEEEDLSTEELLANPSSSLLPRHRPRQSDAETKATLQKFRHLLPETRRQDAVYLLAVRGYYTNSLGRPGVNDRGVYDDAIFVVEPGAVHNFNGNTDPSRSKPGIAQLKAPQAVLYKPGLHGFSRRNGPYPAFRQAGPCTVIRDVSGEDTDRNKGSFFWINLHRGGNTTTSSAGCQTVPPHQWTEFKYLIDGVLKKHGQKDFYYVLVDEDNKTEEAPIEGGEPAEKPVLSDAEQLAEAMRFVADWLKRNGTV